MTTILLPLTNRPRGSPLGRGPRSHIPCFQLFVHAVFPLHFDLSRPPGLSSFDHSGLSHALVSLLPIIFLRSNVAPPHSLFGMRNDLCCKIDFLPLIGDFFYHSRGVECLCTIMRIPFGCVCYIPHTLAASSRGPKLNLPTASPPPILPLGCVLLRRG